MDNFNLKPLLDDIQSVVQFALKKVKLDGSRIAKKVRISIENDAIRVEFVEYAPYVDGGRRKGRKPPPIKAMLDFIDRNNIKPAKVTREELAYMIAAAIARDGIKPRPFLEEIQKKVVDIVNIHIKRFIEDEYQKIF